MARKRSEALTKVLNFFGIVEDEGKRDTYGEEYTDDSYGRRDSYTPAQQNRRSTSTSGSRRRLPASSARTSRDEGRTSRTSDGYDDYRTARPSSGSSARYPRTSREDRPRTSTAARTDNAMTRRTSRAAAPAPRRTRTVMYALRTLKDCCKVIDELIANNTVVLTMEDMDPALMQRALDTLSGAAFALDANIRRASERTYLLAPNSVDVNEGYEEVDEYDY